MSTTLPLSEAFHTRLRLPIRVYETGDVTGELEGILKLRLPIRVYEICDDKKAVR